MNPGPGSAGIIKHAGKIVRAGSILALPARFLFQAPQPDPAPETPSLGPAYLGLRRSGGVLNVEVTPMTTRSHKLGIPRSVSPALILCCTVFGAVAAGAIGPGCSTPSQTEERDRVQTRDGAAAGDPDAGSFEAAWRQDLPAVEIECGDGDSTRLFQERIEPLFADDRPSSCNECHLSGLDLEVFMRDTPCESMACMVSLGLVDEANPDESLVLDWIGRAAPQSSLITEEVVLEEYQGFREWIHYSTQCEECEGVECPGSADGGSFCPTEFEPVAGYQPSDHDPGGCSDEALLRVFRTTVYASRGRCSPCHFTDHEFEKYQAPQWFDVLGDCESASRNTYWNVIDRGYVDFEDPEQSLLLQKPLATDLGGIEHGGHDKFWSFTEDQGYLNFLYFVERYAECR